MDKRNDNAVKSRRPSGLRSFGLRSILVRTAVLSWVVVTLALSVFIGIIIPYQEGILEGQLKSTAEVVATSIDQVTVSSIVVEDYSSVIEHCLKVVGERPEVLYLVITRKGGFSLVHRADGWSYQQLEEWWQPEGERPPGLLMDSELVGQEVYHFSYPFSYSGIDWGWIHIGLSLAQFQEDRRVIYTQTIALGLVCMLAASLVALFFARRVSRPIRQLHEVTERIAAGELEARAEIATGDEVEGLAASFNRMTEALRKSHVELEMRVEERTAELRATNVRLLTEIQERQRAEEAQQTAERELEEQRSLRLRSDRLRSLGEMAAGIAHELNQPLVGVRGLAEHILIAMERGWVLDEETLQERMKSVVEQADRMAHIIEHVRRFAREAGKTKVEEVQVNGAVEAGLEMLEAQFRAHGLGLEAELAEGLPTVVVNAYSLEEVVLNLLSNARDAVQAQRGQKGDGFVPEVVVRSLMGDPGWVQVEVEDNGTGISTENVQRVFDPFFTTKDPDRGTGLGLSISRSIIEEFGGRLELRSEPGEGTKVIISLPAVEQMGEFYRI
jgi:signal transduction histidine kinase